MYFIYRAVVSFNLLSQKCAIKSKVIGSLRELTHALKTDGRTELRCSRLRVKADNKGQTLERQTGHRREQQKQRRFKDLRGMRKERRGKQRSNPGRKRLPNDEEMK